MFIIIFVETVCFRSKRFPVYAPKKQCRLDSWVARAARCKLSRRKGFFSVKRSLICMTRKLLARLVSRSVLSQEESWETFVRHNASLFKEGSLNSNKSYFRAKYQTRLHRHAPLYSGDFALAVINNKNNINNSITMKNSHRPVKFNGNCRLFIHPERN